MKVRDPLQNTLLCQDDSTQVISAWLFMVYLRRIVRLVKSICLFYLGLPLESFLARFSGSPSLAPSLHTVGLMFWF